MGYSELYEMGISPRAYLESIGKIKSYKNELPEIVVTDAVDESNKLLIQQTLGKMNSFKIKRITAHQQKDLLYNGKGRFVSIVHSGEERGTGYQTVHGWKQVDNELTNIQGQNNKFACFGTLYSKYPVKDLDAVRITENLENVSILTQDIDAGKSGMSLREQLERISQLVYSKQMPMFNLIMFTGTGIHIFWLIDNVFMKPGSASNWLWIKTQRYLFEVLDKAGLEPDKSVFQPAHNTRWDGTVNTFANNAVVRGYLINSKRMKLRDFKPYVFEKVRNKVKKPSPERDKSKDADVIPLQARQFFIDIREYAQRFLDDLFLIPKLKDKQGQSLVGMRSDMAAYVLFMAMICEENEDNDEQFALNKLREWWHELPQQQDTNFKEIYRRSKRAFRYYREFLRGKPLNYDPTGKNGHKRAGLFANHRTLIEKWDLNLDIRLQMKCIKGRVIRVEKTDEVIIKDGKAKPVYKRIFDQEFENARLKLYRREKGEQPREAYEAGKEAKMEAIKAVLIHNPKAKLKEIESITNLAYETVKKYAPIVKKELGITKAKSKPKPKKQTKEQIIKAYFKKNPTSSLKNATRELGMSYNTVKRYAPKL